MEKQCSMCKEVKSMETDFHKDSRKSDGLRSNCKSCVSKYQRERNALKRQQAATTEAVVQEEAVVTVPVSEEVASILSSVKRYKKDGREMVKAIAVRKAIQAVIGKAAKNVKQVIPAEEILHFTDLEMKHVLGEDWKPSRHGYVMLDIPQAVLFIENHLKQGE